MSKEKHLCEVPDPASPLPWRYDENTDHGSPIVFDRDGEPVIAFHQADYESEAWFEVEDNDMAFAMVAVNGYHVVHARVAELEAKLRRLRNVQEETAHRRGESCCAWAEPLRRRLDQAEATIARVEALVHKWTNGHAYDETFARELREALAGDREGCEK